LLFKVKTSALKSGDLFELKNGNKDFILSHEPPNVFIELSFGFGLPAKTFLPLFWPTCSKGWPPLL
jgi:hypothetical protein